MLIPSTPLEWTTLAISAVAAWIVAPMLALAAWSAFEALRGAAASAVTALQPVLPAWFPTLPASFFSPPMPPSVAVPTVPLDQISQLGASAVSASTESVLSSASEEAAVAAAAEDASVLAAGLVEGAATVVAIPPKWPWPTSLSSLPVLLLLHPTGPDTCTLLAVQLALHCAALLARSAAGRGSSISISRAGSGEAPGGVHACGGGAMPLFSAGEEHAGVLRDVGLLSVRLGALSLAVRAVVQAAAHLMLSRTV